MNENNNEIINKRYDFVLIFDVKDGNPNGDPDAGNLPRIDMETAQGLVTDVSIKRRVRNYINFAKGGERGYSIFIKEQSVLNDTIEEAFINSGTEDLIKDEAKLKSDERYIKIKPEQRRNARTYLLENFYDIRTFGAVLSTGPNAGQIRGPVQMTFARSFDQIIPKENSITRIAVTSKSDSQKQDGENRTMGRKFIVPYGLYVAYGFVSAPLAEKTGFSNKDLALLWDALRNMYELDRSSSKGLMTTRKLIIFEHDSKLGNCQAQALFDLVKISRKTEGPPRSYEDYSIEIASDSCPQGVNISIK